MALNKPGAGKTAELLNRMAAVPIANVDAQKADLKAFRELEGEINIPDLEAYFLIRRREELQRQTVQLQESRQNDRPFESLSTDRLIALSSYWHEGITAGALEELARRELIHFTQLTYPGYTANWHHVEYAKKLDAFACKKIQKLMVFMPPQHGKSELCTRRMPAKLLGGNPDLRLAIVSYSNPFTSKFNREIQRIIDSDEYRRLFPDTMLSTPGLRAGAWASYVRNADEFEIVGYRGGLVSTGIGGPLTGRPVDILIIDDPYKDQKEAWSPTIRRSVQDWYDTVAERRLHNNSQQLLTLTRWHQDDLAGYLLRFQPGEWEIVKFPGIKEGQPLSHDPREPGEALWPEVHSLKSLEAVKKRNSYVFGAIIQQDPKPAEGLLFPVDSLQYFDDEEIIDMEYDTIVTISDVADKGTDFYFMPIGGVKGKYIDILDIVYTQEPVKVTIPLTLSKLSEWRPSRHRIESNAGGSIFAHTIREQKTTSTTIEEKATTTNKETRILMTSGQIQEYCRFRKNPPAGSQYEAAMSALTSYRIAGGNEHDDVPDGLTMLVDLVHPSTPEATIIMLGGNDENSDSSKQNPFYKRLIGRLSAYRQDKGL